MAADPTLAELTAQLVAIDSTNPDLVAGGAGETEIAAFVAGWLRKAGLEVEVHEPVPGRPSVIGIARGTGGGASLLLNAHMDTVGVAAGMEAPFTPVVKDGRLHGRGAGDMKGSLAAIMLVGAVAARDGLRGDVIVTAVADEEVGSVGTEDVVRRVTAACGDRGRAHRGGRRDRAQGFRRVRDRDGRACRARLAAGLGIDAIALWAPVLTRHRRARRAAARGHAAPAPRHRLGARVGDRGRPGVLELPGRVPAPGRAADVPGETVETSRAELEELAAGTGADGQRPVPPRPVRELGPTPPSCVRCTGTWATRRSAGSPSGPTPRCSRAPASRPSSSGLASTGSTESTSRSTSPRSSAATRPTSPSRGSCAVSALRAVHVGVGLWGAAGPSSSRARPGYRLVALADAAAAGRAWAEAELGVPAFRDLGRALDAHRGRRGRARLAALDAPAAVGARARARAAT